MGYGIGNILIDEGIILWRLRKLFTEYDEISFFLDAIDHANTLNQFFAK